MEIWICAWVLLLPRSVTARRAHAHYTVCLGRRVAPGWSREGRLPDVACMGRSPRFVAVRRAPARVDGAGDLRAGGGGRFPEGRVGLRSRRYRQDALARRIRETDRTAVVPRALQFDGGRAVYRFAR